MFPPETIILILDDILAVRMWQKKVLTSLGFKNILVAENGQEGLTVLAGQRDLGKKVDLIISDWHMPKMDGYAFFKEIQNHPDFKTIPFLMASAESEVENIKKFWEEGIKYYLVKWFTSEQLKRKLEVIWEEENFEKS